MAGAHSVEGVVLGEVDEGVEESKEANPEPLGHNVASAVPEVDDVPGRGVIAKVRRTSDPLGGTSLQVHYLRIPTRW